MFSRKMVVIVGVVVLIVVNIIILTVNSEPGESSFGLGGVAMTLSAPFQEGVIRTTRFVKNIWQHYFLLVSTSIENDLLRQQLNLARQQQTLYEETYRSNARLREMLNFRESWGGSMVAAEVVGKDPSPWYQTVIINKGQHDGVAKGMPVVVPEGIVGVVIDTTGSYSKVLMIIDPNCAVDAQVQRTRARGVIKGDPSARCLFKYVLRKQEVRLGDTVVSSGIDGVFPKGLRIGRVSEIVKLSSGIFQEVSVTPFVNFETIEEVLVIAPPPAPDFSEMP